MNFHGILEKIIKIVMIQLKNWDNKTWLSSASYLNAFNSFLLKKKKLKKNSKILDIGCGRGKIIGSLSRKFKLSNKPISSHNCVKNIIIITTSNINYIP